MIVRLASPDSLEFHAGRKNSYKSDAKGEIGRNSYKPGIVGGLAKGERATERERERSMG